MKKLMILLIMLAGLVDVAAQYNATVVEYTRDVITMRATGYGRKAAKASDDAELSAIKTVLFAGAYGAQYRIPLIKEEQAAVEAEHNDFFEKLYGGGYKNYIESSVVAVPFGKNAVKKKCIVLDVRIRVTQLRSYLENNGIIRKFGL